MESPPKMKNGLIAETERDGKVTINMVKNGKNIKGITVSGDKTSLIAVQLLATAKIAQERTNIQLKDAVETEQSWPVIIPSSFGLGPSQTPGHECLMLRFGEAQLGISIDADSLKQLAQAILALSAKGPVQ